MNIFLIQLVRCHLSDCVVNTLQSCTQSSGTRSRRLNGVIEKSSCCPSCANFHHARRRRALEGNRPMPSHILDLVSTTHSIEARRLDELRVSLAYQQRTDRKHLQGETKRRSLRIDTRQPHTDERLIGRSPAYASGRPCSSPTT